MIFRPLPAGIFAPVGATLTHLEIKGLMTPRQLEDVASTCPLLECLGWKNEFIDYDDEDEDRNHIPFMCLSSRSVTALQRLRDGCPNLKIMPSLKIGDGDYDAYSEPYELWDVAFFDLLRTWPSLQTLIVFHKPFAFSILAKAKAFAKQPGAFKGRLEINATGDEEDYYELSSAEQKRLNGSRPFVAKKHLRVYLTIELEDY